MKILITLLPILLVGCSLFQHQTCEEMNWHLIGQEDGKAGKRSHHFFQHQATCKGKASRSEYLKGMEQGLVDYCRSENAFQLGVSGAAYRNLCPNESEQRFKKRFDLGHQIYRLKTEIEDRKESISEYQQQFRYTAGLSDMERQDINQQISSLMLEQKADEDLIHKLYQEAKLSGLIEKLP